MDGAFFQNMMEIAVELASGPRIRGFGRKFRGDFRLIAMR